MNVLRRQYVLTALDRVKMEQLPSINVVTLIIKICML